MDVFEWIEESRAKEPWRDEAACLGVDTNVFFPDSNVSEARVEEAKAYCRRCPVSEECLSLAVGEQLQDGVFGGMTAKERRNAGLLKRRKAGSTVDIKSRRENRKTYGRPVL